MASTHSYIQNLSDVFTDQTLEDGLEYDMLLIVLPKIVIFPNQTLPLRIVDPVYITYVERLVSGFNNRNDVIHLGIVNSVDINSRNDRIFGTSTQIRRAQISRNSSTELQNTMFLAAKGHKRFRLLSSHRMVGVVFGRVVVQSEYSKLSSYSIAETCSHEYYRNRFPTSVYCCVNPSKLAERSLEMFRRVIKADVSDDFFVDQLQKIPFDVVNQWGESPTDDCSLSRASLDPCGWSFYLSSNLPMNLSKKKALLSIDDTSERLRFLIGEMTDQFHVTMGCSQCRSILFDKSQLFSLPGAEGVSGAYVNPSGLVYETFTVRKLFHRSSIFARVCITQPPTTEFCWYPGYEYSNVYCGRCLLHLGWRYTKCFHPSGNSSTNEEGILIPLPSLGFWVCIPPIDDGFQSSQTTNESSDSDIVSFWGFRSTAVIDITGSNLRREDLEHNRNDEDDVFSTASNNVSNGSEVDYESYSDNDSENSSLFDDISGNHISNEIESLNSSDYEDLDENSHEEDS